MAIRIQEADFDLSVELAALRGNNPAVGALVSFVGLVRDQNDGSRVSEMSLEHYPGMTERTLQAIIDEACRRWSIVDTLVIHRVGRLLPTDQIVLVAVAGTHRDESFAACQFIVDYLKTRAPFWKREVTPAGARWVDARTGDDLAAARWQD
ncbi:molybdenum cofactor biosynthesis protein MoaE [Accumulibacter sp.]|uniref:molybdenum cofactor biosynthesis protein MoaE n=1 Tax=Accumulibacter sp. TaxID=2053492 RepID=UPI002601F772|nr:molybdenum cofactor biosynthesis protein MoaE [Accumulibacter sp.]